MDNDIFRQLLQEHAQGRQLNPEEEALLQQEYARLLEEELNVETMEPGEERGRILRRRIDQVIASRQTKRFRLRDFSRIAAVLLIGITLLAGAFWFWPRKMTADVRAEILPGSNKASLTLSDGSIRVLDNAPGGTLAMQNGVRVEKDADGNLRYHADKHSETKPASINTITTPKGGQYRIILPDGSVAVLNAASSLSYPVCFTGNERRVKMTGEVYFEISKQPLRGGKGNVPFLVESAGQVVQVLGTHFNINAYPDESSVKTTLAEGSIMIRSQNGQSAFLKPGQQAVLAGQLEVRPADISQQLAWVNGDFVFRGETLESVLRQVARWYDVDVECSPSISQLRFNGMISRSQPLSAIIKMIQTTKKATVTIKERRLIVTD